MTDMGARPVALVTGASRGIGAAVARRLARDGMAVAVNSHPDAEMTALATRVIEQIREAGGDAMLVCADVSDPADVDRMVAECEHELGPVSALVLNAAATSGTPWDELPLEEWDRIMRVNLRGAFLCARRAFRTAPPYGGAIVTVSSVLALTGAPNSLPYVTTKAGLIGFTRSLARELGPSEVRVNCVLPGAIRTEAELETYPDRDEADAQVLARQVIGRRGKAEDIANVVSFLVGPDSGFVTGQTVCADGGWVLH